MNVLLAGAGRGIGLAMLRQLLHETRWQALYALHRDDAPALADLAAGDARLKCLRVDQSCDAALETLQETVAGELNWVINTAGLLHSEPLQIGPEKTLKQLDRAALQQVFSVNAINHLLLIKALQPRLSRRGPLKIASLSARVGSIGDNRLGGWYGYRASKAALNQLMHTLAIELRRYNRSSVCVTLHPGTTDTGLSRPFQKNVPSEQLFSSEYAAGMLLEVMNHLTPEQTGGFYAYDGEPIPW
ncbi:MAG: SDR family NAD(P)-dependent oxidoreductase [Halothiobacillaceae bacterium]